MKLESDTGRGCQSKQEDGLSCCLHMLPSIRDEIKIYSLPADCSDLFSAPDRGSFGLFLGPQIVGKKGSAVRDLRGAHAAFFVSCQAIFFFLR